MSKNFPYYHQLDAMDCGPTCLRMVAKHYGKHYSLETLRHGVQQTGGGAEKERCPSRGIALMFYRPHRDVPCRKAPQVAYIVVFVTRWHKKSGGKDTTFPFRMADPKRARKFPARPAVKEEFMFNLKLKEMKKLNSKLYKDSLLDERM